MLLGLATLDRSPDHFPGVRPISPSHQELHTVRGTRRGGPPGWNTDQVGLGVHSHPGVDIFLDLSPRAKPYCGVKCSQGCTSLSLLLLERKTVVPQPRT